MRPGLHFLALLCTGIMVVMLPSSSASGVANTAHQRQSVEQVEEVIKGIIAADNAGDLNSAMSYYSDDAVLISPSGPDVIGKTQIRAHYKALFETSTLAISNEIIDTTTSGNWAISRGVNRVVATSRVDNTTTTVSSKYLMTLRRNTGNDWLIVHLMWTNQSLPGKPQ